ncbi:MAG: hypothetical protein AABY83_08935 [Pseudomonadota bacterium]
MPIALTATFTASRHVSLHATLVSVWGCGVLLCGAPGAGKSSLALALVAQGQRLVIDDLVLLSRDGTRLIGSGVPGWQGKLLIPEHGLLDVGELYGAKATQRAAPIGAAVYLYTGKPTPIYTAQYALPTCVLRRAAPAHMAQTVADWVHRHGVAAPQAHP